MISRALSRNRLLAHARILFLLAAAWPVGAGSLALRGETVSEYDLKAAYLSNFVQFVKWPGAGSGVVGILGDDPFGTKLEAALQGKLSVKRSRKPEDLKGCKVVFIAKSERGSLGGILASLAGTGVLTVGESEGFAKQGGIIGFTMEGERVRFEINTRAAQRGGLEISSRLLKLATRLINS